MKLPNSRNLRQKLQGYLESDADFRAAYDYTHERFEAAKQLTAHNWEHARRDTLNAIVIGEAEGADMTIVLPAIVMHDIGFLYGANGKTHGAVGADKLAEYLEAAGIKLEPVKLAHISDCIRTHKGSTHGENPETLEAKVVSDSDMLDKFGPVGIYQVIRTFTEFNANFEESLNALANESRRFQTATGNELAADLKPFNAQFVQALSDAYEPYRSDQEDPT